MNKAQKRASAIRSELVRMSHQGWRHVHTSDYWPLEAELRKLDEAKRGAKK